MKKILLFCTAVAVALAMTAPANAELKLTSKGYMQVQNLYMDKFILERNAAGVTQDHSNDWFNMKMIVDPVLHVTDKVRIFGQIAAMQRNYSGTATGDLYSTNAAQTRYNVYDDKQNNFWLERLYLAFPLFVGTTYIGRQEGGNWAYPFMDSDYNADRIKWVGTLPGAFPLTIAAVYQKSAERRGGELAPRFTTVNSAGAANTGFNAFQQNQDSYGLGFVVPFTKQIVWKPLFWYTVDSQLNNLPGAGAGARGNYWDLLFSDGFTFDFKPFRLDYEFDYWTGKFNSDTAAVQDLDISQWQMWGDASYGMGPIDVGLTGFWIQGSDHSATSSKRLRGTGTGILYQPLLLTFSEDMGILFNSAGVPNGSTENLSGYVMIGGHAGYKLTDAMKISAIFAYLRADKMAGAFDAADVSKDLGYELDATFEWAFMSNIKYILDGGYFWTGDYFKDFSQGGFAGSLTGTTPGTDVSQNFWGVRNTIRVEW